jgi:prepilin-type N-terminal cleavage/methylation domain-containing protein
MKKNKGFTIVELLITIALLAVVVVIGLNMGRSAVQRAKFTAAINQFVADFSLARQLASRENRYVAIDFDDNGTSYRILVQKQVQTPLTEDTSSYEVNKTVEPYGGESFVSGAQDFAVNSMGVIRAFPVNTGSAPLTVTLNFFRKQGLTDNIDYQSRITIYPSGGVKIEKQK